MAAIEGGGVRVTKAVKDQAAGAVPRHPESLVTAFARSAAGQSRINRVCLASSANARNAEPL
jgi:hypothetical protein